MFQVASVSIRRADLGLLELEAVLRGRGMGCSFQSAGRIWGFWNQWRDFAGDLVGPVSIRRADLGLLERRTP